MTEGFFGQRGIFDDATPFNLIRFIIRQELAQVRTGVPVSVIAVHGGGVGAPPTVDVQVLVNQIDGQGNQTPHGTIFGIPCMRVQGGANAIINDPAVGDIGHLQINDRDISAIKSNAGKQSNPGSFRRHNLADGVYVGAMLNPGSPNQYIQWTTTGFKIADKNGNIIEMKSGSIAITGNLTVTGGITAGFGTGDAVTLQHHTHSGGSPPTPGT